MPIVPSHATVMTGLVLTAVALHAVQQTPAPRPTFKGQVTVVEVDVVAMRKSGELVRGLRQDDFEVLEDGSPVAIASFQPIELPDSPVQPTIAPSNRSGSAFASNDQSHDGRVLLIVLDDVQFGSNASRLQRARAVARRAVERLGPADLAAFMTVTGAGDRVDFTTNKSLLLEAIDRFRLAGEILPPETPGGLSPGPGIGNRTATSKIGDQSLPATSAFAVMGEAADARIQYIEERRTVAAMRGLTTAARALGTVRNRRKSVLLISQGFPATLTEITERSRLNAAYQAIRDFMTTAQRNNIPVYTFDPCGFEQDWGCSNESRDDLRTLAEVTGGFATVNTDVPEAAVDRLVAESGSYYLISYYSPAPPNDGKSHKITVRTRVPGVETRARAGYDAPKKAEREAVLPPLDALTRAAIQTRGITMRLVAIPVPLTGDPGAAVVIGIDVAGAAAARAGRIEFAAVAVDHNGRTHGPLRFKTDFTAVKGAAWARTASRLDLAPGRYDIRVAAVGADQSAGSVFTGVMVPDFRTELAVGGLSIGIEAGMAISAADRARVALPLIPFAISEVVRGEPVTAQLPMSVAAKAASQPLTIVSTLTAPDGTTLPLDRTVGTGRDYASRGGRVHKVTLPPTLAPGHHRLVVESTLGGTTVVRELAVTVLPSR